MFCVNVFSKEKIKWYVYEDSTSTINHGEWSNIMPKNCGSTEIASIDLNNKTNPVSGSSAVKLKFVVPVDPGWCGLMVSSKSGFWGDRIDELGNDFSNAPFYNLYGYSKLVYFAKGDNGGENIQVKFSITGGHELGDSAPLPFDCGNIELTKNWKKYECPIAKEDKQYLNRVISPFVVIVSKNYNQGFKEVVFYLDNIYFEK